MVRILMSAVGLTISVASLALAARTAKLAVAAPVSLV